MARIDVSRAKAKLRRAVRSVEGDPGWKDQVSRIVTEELQLAAPVNTGALRDSIGERRRDELSVTVGTGVHQRIIYARAVDARDHFRDAAIERIRSRLAAEVGPAIKLSVRKGAR